MAEGSNPLIGGGFMATAQNESATVDVAPAAAADESDGTEWVVAAFAVGALALLVLFRAVGLQAVIAARVG